jgi:glycosyltransferase involved in cell wall biosynthesis
MKILESWLFFMDGNIKKVLVCITLPDLGGAQRVVYDTISSLDQFKFNICLATSAEGILTKWVKILNERRVNRINIVIIPDIKREISPIHDIKALYCLYKLIKKNNFDIVHLHSSKAGILGRCAAWLAGVPMILFTVHGWGINEYQGKIKQKILGLSERIASRLCTRVICVSNYDFEKGIAKKWVKKEKACVIYNGVEYFVSEDLKYMRQDTVKDKKYIIGTIMRLQEPKDPIFTIKVFHEIRLRLGNCVKLVIAGNGKLKPECVKLVCKLGLEEDIDILGECEDARERLCDFDVFTLFSRSEGLPISIIEAMIAGKPIVASKVGGIPELVKDNDNGMLVKERNVLEAAQHIETLLKNPYLRERMGLRSKEIAELNFSKEQMTTAYENIYLSLE